MSQGAGRKRSTGSVADAHAALPNPKRAIMMSQQDATDAAPPLAATAAAAAASASAAAASTAAATAASSAQSAPPPAAGNAGAGQAAEGMPDSYVLTVSQPNTQADLNVAALRVQNHQLAVKVKRLHDQLSAEKRSAESALQSAKDLSSRVQLIDRYVNQLFKDSVHAISAAGQSLPASAAGIDGPNHPLNAAFSSVLTLKDTAEADSTAQKICQLAMETLKTFLSHVSSTSAGGSINDRLAQLQRQLHDAELKERAAQDQLTAAQKELQAAQAKLADGEFALEKNTNELYRVRDRFNATERRALEAEKKVGELEAALARSKPQAEANQHATAPTSAEVENIKMELQEERLVSNARLQEAQELRRQLQATESQLVELRHNGAAGHAAADPTTSPEYHRLLSEMQTLQAVAKNLEIELQEKRTTMSQLETAQFDAASRFETLLEELRAQTEDRLQILQEDLAQSKRELDHLRPIADEVNSGRYKSALEETQQLLASVQTQNRHLLQEVERYKQAAKEAKQALEEAQSSAAQPAASDSDLQRKIAQLTQELQAKKMDEEALFAEMEVTGAAFEDLQAQNARLLEQLRDKDTANSRMMAETVRVSQRERLLKDEGLKKNDRYEAMKRENAAKTVEVTSVTQSERQMRQHVETLTQKLQALEHEAGQLRTQMQSRAQALAAKDLEVEQLRSQLSQAQADLKNKIAVVHNESDAAKRLREDLESLQRKYDRVKKRGGNVDEVLEAEVAEMRQLLRCAACNMRQKDTVITKCFHVFCEECVRTQIKTRQRKCPQCTVPFGDNDYQRIYLT